MVNEGAPQKYRPFCAGGGSWEILQAGLFVMACWERYTGCAAWGKYLAPEVIQVKCVTDPPPYLAEVSETLPLARLQFPAQ